MMERTTLTIFGVGGYPLHHVRGEDHNTYVYDLERLDVPSGMTLTGGLSLVRARSGLKTHKSAV